MPPLSARLSWGWPGNSPRESASRAHQGPITAFGGRRAKGYGPGVTQPRNEGRNQVITVPMRKEPQWALFRCAGPTTSVARRGSPPSLRASSQTARWRTESAN